MLMRRYLVELGHQTTKGDAQYSGQVRCHGYFREHLGLQLAKERTMMLVYV
jgi:hypothetical protein